MRKPFIAGNWKMHKTIAEAVAFVDELKGLVGDVTGVDIAICPPFTALDATARAAAGTNFAVGAQGMFWKDKGAYTGEIAPSMLVDVGCKYVIIGHSERRGRFGVPEEGMTEEMIKVFGDTDDSVNVKMKAALAAGLIPILCVGEALGERKSGRTDAVVRIQVQAALDGLTSEQVSGVVFAYEPVWAIGTGEVCESNEANRVCGLIRQTVSEVSTSEVADTARIQYGGSVKPDNIEELIAKSDIDGALVGGASLKVDSFAAIVKATVTR